MSSNHKEYTQKNQEKGAKSFKQAIKTVVFDPKPLPSIVLDPQAALIVMNDSDLTVLNEMIRLASKYKSLFPSQTLLSIRTGFSRQTINVALKRLEDNGLVASIYRHRRTKLYRLSSFFNNPMTRTMLAGILPALRIIPLVISLLFSFRSMGSHDDVVNRSSLFYRHFTPRNIRYLDINNNLTVHRYYREMSRGVLDKDKHKNYIERVRHEDIRGVSMMREDIMVQLQRYVYGDDQSSKRYRYLKDMGLTLKGEAYLFGFDQEVLTRAIETYIQVRIPPRNPFNYLISLCKNHATKQQKQFKKINYLQICNVFGIQNKDATSHPQRLQDNFKDLNCKLSKPLSSKDSFQNGMSHNIYYEQNYNYKIKNTTESRVWKNQKMAKPGTFVKSGYAKNYSQDGYDTEKRQASAIIQAEKAPRVRNIGYSAYDLYKSQQTPVKDRICKLKESIARSTLILENPEEHFKCKAIMTLDQFIRDQQEWLARDMEKLRELEKEYGTI